MYEPEFERISVEYDFHNPANTPGSAPEVVKNDWSQILGDTDDVFEVADEALLDDNFDHILDALPQFSPESSLEVNDNATIASEKLKESRLKRFGRYVLSRSTAWTEWVVGISAGNAIAETGVGRIGATALVVAGVYKIESLQTSKAREKEIPIPVEPKAPKPTEVANDNGVTRAIKKTAKVAAKGAKVAIREVGAFASSSWQGAPATMNHNRAFGIKNTKKRGNIQSLTYAAWVGLWVSPLPFAETARGKAKNAGLDAMEYAINNPIQSAVGTLTAAGLFFLFYEKMENRKRK